MSAGDSSQVELLGLLPRTGRGPKRDGLFALWLLLRVAQDLLLDPPLAERAVHRRLASLDTRLSSLAVPPPLRRALTAALAQLREGGPRAVAVVLSNLVAPARETAGPEAADAIQRAARTARQSAGTQSR